MKPGSGLWRVALITGGGTGIGRAIALALAKRGVAVALVGRRQEPLEHTASEVGALGGDAIAIPADLTDAAARCAAIAATAHRLGPIDTLINNAALFAAGALDTQTPEAIMQVVTTNLTVPIALTQLLLPNLIAQQGRVVLIGSTTSFVPLPYLSLYGATKAGLHHFGETLRYELRPRGVHLLTAYPPTTATPMTADMAAAMGKWRGRWPFRPASAEDIGEAIIRALAAGKEACVWWSGEHLLRHIYQVAPRLTARLLFAQRRYFAQMVGE